MLPENVESFVMMIEKKWVKTLGLALSLPSTIFAVAIISMKLVEFGVIRKWLGVLIFLLVVGNTIFLMVWYAYKNKDKS